jgi:1-acyl-sn-glycerol-3-phosphate acyltransferase
MQNIVIDKPYRFVPPGRGIFWPHVLKYYLRWHTRKHYGVRSSKFLGLERLTASIGAGHGVMLASNHCRPCDPMVLGLLAARINQPLFVMASWHLFMQSRVMGWLLPRGGVFSIYREGMDREALKCAIDILISAERPLVIFPEGAVSRSNDRLTHLMEGTAFIARNAAKKRAELNPPGKVVLHPVALRYFFGGDVRRAIVSVLEDIERRLSWQPQTHKSLDERITKVGSALLTLKEIEYLEEPRAGTLAERLAKLIDCLLLPLEQEWLQGKREKEVAARVKALRTAILPDMVSGEIDESERARRWRQLADIYLSQQLSLYPPGYFSSPPTAEQMLETVERFEEDLTDVARVHRPMHVVVEVGEAIEVSPTRERGAETDPLMLKLRSALEGLLEKLKEQRPPAS